MTVQDVIDAARSWTAISNSAFFSSDDELRSANRAYRDIYERLVDADNEYFLSSDTVAFADLDDLGRRMYETVLPADFYRLRMVMAIQGDDEMLLSRRDPHERREGYRIMGTEEVTFGEGEAVVTTTQAKLRIWADRSFDSLYIEYYPTPKALTSAEDELVYPPQLEPLILAYQMAIDICNINKDDASRFRAEYAALWDRFLKASKKRDNFNRPRVANIYNRFTSWGW